MRIIEPGYTIIRPQQLDETTRAAITNLICTAGNAIDAMLDITIPGEGTDYIRNLIVNGETDALDHASMTVRFCTDPVTARMIEDSFIFSSIREEPLYHDFKTAKHGNELCYIQLPKILNEFAGTAAMPKEKIDRIIGEWTEACFDAEWHYMNLIQMGLPAFLAGSILNASVRTGVIVTGNMNQWRTFLSAFFNDGSPQIRCLVRPLAAELAVFMPELFGDILIC